MPAMTTGISSKTQYGFADTDLISTSGVIERDVKIFRAGTFTDSMGRTKTWTVDQFDIAVQNFFELRDRNILPNIPVREDHTTSIKDVVGYLAGLRREGDLLVADVEWASPEAKRKWDSRQYRNRSVEIGQYVDNTGQKYDPVVLGLAFVDLPAVEGLYRIADHGGDMPEENTPTPDPTAAAEPEVTPEETPEVTPEPAAVTPEPESTPEPEPELVGAHSAHRPQVHTFRIGGTDVSDYARVQAHIDALETFQEETVQGARAEFVAGLVSNKIITAPQGESFSALVPTMTTEQFAQFKAGFEGAAPANLFARHDLGEGGDPQEVNAAADRISILEGIVASHRARGASEESIAKMASFQELQTLKSASA